MFEAILARFVAAGWADDALTKRAWLDAVEKLKTLCRKDPAHGWEAFIVCELDVAATKEPALDVVLGLGRLRRSVGDGFPIEAEKEVCDDRGERVTFSLGDHEHTIPISRAGDTNTFELLAAANRALDEAGLSRRFHPLAIRHGKLALAFLRPETITRSLHAQLCPKVPSSNKALGPPL